MTKAFAAAVLCCVTVVLTAAETYTPDTEGYVRDWLIGGPYPSYQVKDKPQGYATDLLSELGGEEQADPHSGLSSEVEFRADKSKLIAGIGSTNEWGYKETKTFAARWRDVHADKPNGVISLDGMFAPLQDHIVAYAFCYVEAPKATSVAIRVGSDDDHKVWLNGTLLGGVNKSRPVTDPCAVYKTKLKRGLNRLLLKVVDRTHGHALKLALTDKAGKPLPNLHIRLEHPRHKLLATVPDLQRVDAWDRGFYAGFSLAATDCFAGANDLAVQVGTPSAGKYTVALTLDSGGKTIASREQTAAPDAANELVTWSEPVELPPGRLDIRIAIRDDAGTPVADLHHALDVIDLEALRAENTTLVGKIATTGKQLSDVQGMQAALDKSVENLQRRRKKLYAEIERAYADKRKGLRSNPPAVDEPLTPATVTRRRICLNGDQWLAAPGKKTKDAQAIPALPAPNAWQPITLPLVMFGEYFRTWSYPLKNADPKNRYGKVEPLPGWPGFEFNPLTCSRRTWFRKTLRLTAEEAASACTFVCGNVSGRLTVSLNGKRCGEYFGNIGIVSIPLTGMKEGDNDLDLYLVSPRDAGTPQGKFTSHWGLRGDIFLDIAAPVRVATTTVKTSWRHAQIEVATEIENRGAAPARVRIDRYCVLGNRIRYRFAQQDTQIAAGKTTSVESAGIWTEAKLWGIGGVYGDPVLYDLVTDVYVDGQLRDRHIEPFGFREFWVAGTDFYLNGKRIILQGDVGLGALTQKKLEVILPLLRADGINTIRIHDSDHWNPEFFRVCDRLGMLAYAQMYPILHEKKPKSNFEPGKQNYIPYDDWLEHPLHTYNLRNYERWERMLRNHPSVVIAATDNEIFTQAWDRPEREAFNIRNDRLGAWYGRYVKSLNPALIMTRDGDEGTWGHKGKWQEDPPCDTANYHYPDFHVDEFALNWQTVYDFRPAVFGETLYCSYGAWDNWIGAIPSQVQKKANKVRKTASLYRRLGIPAQIYMGLSSDGFIQIDDTGKSNPWGVTAAMHQECKDKGVTDALPRYPWAPVAWPSSSGPGVKPPAATIHMGSYGHKTVNWFDPAAPSHRRNAVNDAYRDSLIPMPPLADSAQGECLVELGADGKGRTVIARAENGAAVARGVVADGSGTAWFQLPAAGGYTFECEGQTMQVNVPSRAAYAAKPGFTQIARVKWNAAK